MIVEMRTYTIRSGRVAEYVETYGRLGRQTQVQHLGRPLGYFTSEIGALNQIVHLWCYEDIADRDARRAHLEGDSQWKAYLKVRDEGGLLERQENRILRAVTFPVDALYGADHHPGKAAAADGGTDGRHEPGRNR